MEARIRAAMGARLHQACENGDLGAILGHISHQRAVNPSYKPPFQEMLYTATGKDNLHIVKYCLENGAAVTDNVLKKLLICRAKKAYIFFLQSKAVDVNHYISWYGDILSNAATANDLDWVRLCLEHGADPNKNLVDEHMRVLAAVAQLASVEMAALLIEHGARVQGSGAIVMAAEEGNLNMVEMLLDKGADIDEIGIEHPTDEMYREDMGSALHRAVNGSHRDVVRFLIEKGANVHLKDVLGRTPLDLALARKNNDIVKMLEASGATSSLATYDDR
ncbi:MAG: hypothetical protein Q9163_004739 [Psora crenata]